MEMAIDHFVTRSTEPCGGAIERRKTTGDCNGGRPRGRGALEGAARGGAARWVVASPEVVILTLTRPVYRGSCAPDLLPKTTHPFCGLGEPVLRHGQSYPDESLATRTER
jgi:hypothetical protein